MACRSWGSSCSPARGWARRFARRIAGGHYDAETDERISALQEEVAEHRHLLQETQERVELAERLLSRGDRVDPLPR